MKILIASDLHYPTINGVATFSRNLARGLADLGHEVVVIAPSQTGKKCKEVDGNHVIIRTNSVPFPFYQNFRISPNPAREVRKIIEDFDPDVIHIQMVLWLGSAALKYGNKFGIPIVSTNHAMPENLMDNLKLLAPVSRPINYILKAYGARFHSKADYVTLPTQAAIDMFNAGDKIKIPMAPVSNGIDLARFTPQEAPKSVYEKFHLPIDVPIVTYIGRLDAEKHISVLVRAFVRVNAQHPEAHLLIVGDGTDAPRLKSLVKEFGLQQHVTFTGKVSDEDLVLLHRVGTVYCMPSPAELQSIATLEAMASGQPIVAVDAGALRELCQHERNGYLCEQDNDEEIAAGIVSIIEDASLRESMSKESFAIAKTHDLQTTLKQFEKIYQDLIKA
ncbi:MAG TPA: glycosyltransferase [Candidatus Saccharimonadaceae bacterium]|nr:glycosyltransferase [Candidatus Saccharimonadaceae bacterium]